MMNSTWNCRQALTALVWILCVTSLAHAGDDFYAKDSAWKRYTLCQLGILRNDFDNGYSAHLVLGQSFVSEQSQIDVAANFTVFPLVHDEVVTFITFPEITYKHFLVPSKKPSTYLGLGASYGHYEADETWWLAHLFDDKPRQSFTGVFGSVLIGHYFDLNSRLNPHVELKISHGLAASSRNGASPTIPVLAFGVRF